jgi:hypothetical protein
MGFLLETFALVMGLSTLTVNTPPASAHLRRPFGNRMQGEQPNRNAIARLERQTRSFGYSNVHRHRFLSGSGALEKHSRHKDLERRYLLRGDSRRRGPNNSASHDRGV